MTSSVIYYSTDALKNEIYLLNIAHLNGACVRVRGTTREVIRKNVSTSVFHMHCRKFPIGRKFTADKEKLRMDDICRKSTRFPQNKRNFYSL